jgi:hypothetical protein
MTSIDMTSIDMTSIDMNSTDMSAANLPATADTAAEVEAAPATGEWVETALTVMFTAAAVLFVSFLAVVSGIV